MNATNWMEQIMNHSVIACHDGGRGTSIQFRFDTLSGGKMAVISSIQIFPIDNKPY